MPKEVQVINHVKRKLIKNCFTFQQGKVKIIVKKVFEATSDLHVLGTAKYEFVVKKIESHAPLTLK